MRALIERIEVENEMHVLRFVRLDGYDAAEFFFVERGGKFYVLRFASAGGISFDALVMGDDRGSVEREYDLSVENERKQTGVGTGTGIGIGGEQGISTEKMDATAERHLRVFDHPTFGVNWEKSREASSDIGGRAAEQFRDLLTTQLKDWKGSANGLHAAKHRYWPTFLRMVQDAVRVEHGSRFVLYRGLRGVQAEVVLDGKDLPLRPYSSWTSKIGMARRFRGIKGDTWAIVSSVFSSEDVALAPVALPGYSDPEILRPLASDVYGGGDELIVHSSGGKLPKGTFRVVSSSRAGGTRA